jgi:hypothetical protein
MERDPLFEFCLKLKESFLKRSIYRGKNDTDANK